MPIIIKHGGDESFAAGLSALGGFVQGYGQRKDELRRARMEEQEYQKKLSLLDQQIQLNKARIDMIPLEQRALGADIEFAEAKVQLARQNLADALRQAEADEAGAAAISAAAEELLAEDPEVVEALSRSTDSTVSINVFNTAYGARQKRKELENQQRWLGKIETLQERQVLTEADMTKLIKETGGDPFKMSMLAPAIVQERQRRVAVEKSVTHAQSILDKRITEVAATGVISNERLTALTKIQGELAVADTEQEVQAAIQQANTLLDPASAAQQGAAFGAAMSDARHAEVEQARMQQLAMALAPMIQQMMGKAAVVGSNPASMVGSPPARPQGAGYEKGDWSKLTRRERQAVGKTMVPDIEPAVRQIVREAGKAVTADEMAEKLVPAFRRAMARAGMIDAIGADAALVGDVIKFFKLRIKQIHDDELSKLPKGGSADGPFIEGLGRGVQ